MNLRRHGHDVDFLCLLHGEIMERRGENICLFIVFLENCPSLRFEILGGMN